MTIRIDSPEQDAAVGVNSAKDGINGLIIAEEGPFKSGRGRFNLQSLERIVSLGNDADRGIRKRAQHPNASDDGLGTGVGTETNYRIDKRENGNHVVRADMLFSKAGMEMNPKGQTPWGPYLMSELAENPESFQNSIVLKYEEAEDELTGTDETLPPLWMPTSLRASDFVDTGDATHGDSLSEDDMISWLQDGSSRRSHVKLTAVLSTQLDRAFPDADPEVIRPKLVGFIDKYLSNRFDEYNTLSTEEINMDQEVQAALAAQEEKFTALSESIVALTELVKGSQAKAEQALAAKSRSEEIAALCQMSGSTEAAKYIADANLSVSDVKDHLFKDLASKVTKLGEDEGDVAPSAWDKLNAEYHKNQELLSKAGWTIDSWKKAQATDRGIEIPENAS